MRLITNNRGDAELAAFFSIAIIVIVAQWAVIARFMQWNSTIVEQKRFRIVDSVYQCSLIKTFEVEDSKEPK